MSTLILEENLAKIMTLLVTARSIKVDQNRTLLLSPHVARPVILPRVRSTILSLYNPNAPIVYSECLP